MAQSLARVAVHLVFSTKHREPWLRDSQLRVELYAYMAMILRNNVDSPALLIGGLADHVHALLLMSRGWSWMSAMRGSVGVDCTIAITSFQSQSRGC